MNSRLWPTNFKTLVLWLGLLSLLGTAACEKSSNSHRQGAPPAESVTTAPEEKAAHEERSPVVNEEASPELSSGKTPAVRVEKNPAVSFEKRPLRVLQVQLGGQSVFKLLVKELSQPRAAGAAAVPVQEILLPDRQILNPFAISRKNYQLPRQPGEYVLSEKEAQWFEQQIQEDRIPDLFYIGGHHVPGLGFHSDETDSLNFYQQTITLSTLQASIEKYPAVKKYFASIPLVFLGGCWSLANLEPHGKNGEYLSPEEIKRIYFSSPEGKQAMIGSPADPYSLEAQRHELATLYSADFTRVSAEEDCEDVEGQRNCRTYWADRVLSDEGLYDGSHRYNYPYLMKKMFSGAQVIFGFHSPSPYNSQAAEFYKAMFREVRQKQTGVGNILEKILNPAASIVEKKSLIQNMRQSWSKATYELNRNRTAGSVTPLYPELDANGPFVEFGLSQILRNYPYEKR